MYAGVGHVARVGQLAHHIVEGGRAHGPVDLDARLALEALLNQTHRFPDLNKEFRPLNCSGLKMEPLKKHLNFVFLNINILLYAVFLSAILSICD